MADDPSNRGRQDRDRINVEQEHELRYWSSRFGVSQEELRKAVAEVGPMAKAVEQRLRARQ